MRILFSLILMLFVSTVAFAQIPPVSEAQVQQEMENRDMDEDDAEEVRLRLLARGFDIDNLDTNNLFEFETALKEVLAEIEEEKKEERDKEKIGEEETAPKETKKSKKEEDIADDLREVAKNSSEDIQDAVEDGSSIEEAVSEELLEAQEDVLPPAEVYGQHIFREKSIKLYRKSNDIKPPLTYVLGVGDEIAVSIYGFSQESLTFEVNEEGFILPPDMAPIYLKGFSYGEAKELLRKRFSKHYRFENNEFKMTLNFSRTISVNIVGEVFNYGSFTLPAINNAFNALVAAGGPSDIGSVRNIQLIRAGESPVNIDIYEYLLHPKAQSELYLMENDYIHVPVAEKIVEINGLINRPFKYELNGSEGLKDLVAFAGGFKEDAYLSNIQIKRYVNDEELILDVNYRNLESGGGNYSLLNGDEVIVNKIPKPYDNFIEIDGAVDMEGKYALRDKMKISDLLAKTKLERESRSDVAYLRRINEDLSVKYYRLDLNEIMRNTNSPQNIELKPKDKLMVFEKSKFVDKTKFTVNGAVRQPNKFEYDINQNIKVEDAIIMTGGLTPDASDIAYIYRKDPTRENSLEYVRINIREVIDNPSSSQNKWLQANDSLVIFSRDYYREKTSVEVLGAIRNPGNYPYDLSLGLKDVLTLAGGISIIASRTRIDVYRIEFQGDKETRTVAATFEVDENLNVLNGDNDNFQLKPFDKIVIRLAPEFELQKIVRIDGEVKYPGEYALLNDNETITSVIKRAGGLTTEAFASGAILYRVENNMGFVIMELEEAMKNKNSSFNYILKHEDVIEIPKKQDLVSIIGETQVSEYYPDKIAETGRINVAFNKGKKAKYYVDKYAGVGKNGLKRLITVEHANGQVERTRNYLLFRKYPPVYKGSTILIGNAIVEKQKDKDGKEKKKIDWGKVFSDSIGQATAILSLILLVQRVN